MSTVIKDGISVDVLWARQLTSGRLKGPIIKILPIVFLWWFSLEGYKFFYKQLVVDWVVCTPLISNDTRLVFYHLASRGRNLYFAAWNNWNPRCKAPQPRRSVSHSHGLLRPKRCHRPIYRLIHDPCHRDKQYTGGWRIPHNEIPVTSHVLERTMMSWKAVKMLW